MRQKTDQQVTADKLVAALKQDRFILYSQPIKPIRSAADNTGYQEILIRYLDEEEKLLPPGGFFPILERHKLMPMLDRWVVNRVIRWLLAKQSAHRNWNPSRCSVNLSRESIANVQFSNFVKEQLQTSKLSPGVLSFEVSEPDAEALAVALDRHIAELKPLGCSFVLTSYSGEFIAGELLQALGVSFVKIDGDIIRNIHHDHVSLAKTRLINLSCQALGIRTIGEMVERPETLEKLKELGVDYAQGYGIARPQPLM